MKLVDIPEKFFGPENYMEYENRDIRLSISKINSFIETLGDALLSLTYCNKQEHPNTDERLLNIIRRIHVRHAIVDLNNSFDLLLQVPWFLYRGWLGFNFGGPYCHPKHKAKNDIIRNTPNWVESVENSCNYKNVILFLNGSTEPSLNTLASFYEVFNNDFRFNSTKQFVVRSVANQIKHKHNIMLKEFYEPYTFNMVINEKELNLKEQNLYPEIVTRFYDMETNVEHGQIKARYKDDLEIDIEYDNGEVFLGKDLINQRNVYAIDDLINEMHDYYNGIVDLYNQILTIINDEIHENPFTKVPTIKKTTSYNMDEFFKSNI